MKICPMEVELLHADRLTNGRKDRRTNGPIDMTKLIVAFRILLMGLKKNMHKEGGIVYADLRIMLVG
jgi:hypothetical protein